MLIVSVSIQFAIRELVEKSNVEIPSSSMLGKSVNRTMPKLVTFIRTSTVA